MATIAATLRLVGTVALGALGTTAAMAQKAPIPNLVGTWVAVEGGALWWHGKAPRIGEGHELTIEIDQQEDAYFSGEMTYTNPPDVHAHDGSALVTTGKEDFVGVIDWDGETISFADTPDVGFWHGRLIDDNTIALVALEAGEHALAGRFLLER